MNQTTCQNDAQLSLTNSSDFSPNTLQLHTLRQEKLTIPNLAKSYENAFTEDDAFKAVGATKTSKDFGPDGISLI